MIARKSSAASDTLEKQNISEMFPPSLVLFQSYLFVRAYVGLKDKPVNIVRILVLYRCISRPCRTVYSSAALIFVMTVERRNFQLLKGFILNGRFRPPLLHEPGLASTRLRGSTHVQSVCNKCYIGSALLGG